jgi:hypothetical protein
MRVVWCCGGVHIVALMEGWFAMRNDIESKEAAGVASRPLTDDR